MRPGRPRPTHWIWGLSFGYFAFYIPYSAMVRALSRGLLPGMDEHVPGFLLLPATAMATTPILLVFVSVGGGWKYLERCTFLGLTVPAIRSQTFWSGLATAVIILTTTLSYTFQGISILLALLMMRGGVLVLAPLVDLRYSRRVHPCSWIALALSLLAIAMAFSDVNSYHMTLGAVVNISAYLGGYVFRLNLMTRLAKSTDPTVNRRYFLEETLVAAIAVTLLPAALALLGTGEVGTHARAGFTTFFGQRAAFPALMIGLLYGCLYLFGTGIYLDKRENTFSIPLNRCASLLSGLVAAYGLHFLLNLPAPNWSQLAGAAIILSALFCLLFSTVAAPQQAGQKLLQGVFLFVCGGNTSRSPMAQAICNDEIRRLLGLEASGGRIRALSAGLTAKPGNRLTEAAIDTLRHLSVPPHEHASREVTAELIEEAELVFCMTADQCRQLAERFPKAESKIQPLDPNGDIDDPSGHDMEIYRKVGAQLQNLIRQQLPGLVE